MTVLRTPLEVAQRLRCSRRTLDEHVRSGALRYISIGHGKKRQRKMFTDADVDEFIERQTRRDVPFVPEVRTRVRRSKGSTSISDGIDFLALRAERQRKK